MERYTGRQYLVKDVMMPAPKPRWQLILREKRNDKGRRTRGIPASIPRGVKCSISIQPRRLEKELLKMKFQVSFSWHSMVNAESQTEALRIAALAFVSTLDAAKDEDDLLVGILKWGVGFHIDRDREGERRDAEINSRLDAYMEAKRSEINTQF